jgi:hypothetical protein
VVKQLLYWIFASLFLLFFIIPGIGFFRVQFLHTPMDQIPTYMDFSFTTLSQFAAGALAFSLAFSSMRSKGKGRIFRTNKQINSFLKAFIKKGTTVDIFSNKLSWVAGDTTVQKCLTKHQSRGNAIWIYLPKANKISRQLESGGINVVEYGASGFEPSCRFTLLNRGSAGSRALAVGSGVKPNFIIKEFKEAEDPKIVALAEDLTTILRKTHK